VNCPTLALQSTIAHGVLNVIAPATLLTGCYKWEPVELAPSTFTTPPVELRATRSDGWRVVMSSAELEHDTLRGVRAGEPFDSIFMSVSQVASVAVRRGTTSPELTAIGVLLGFLATATVLVLIGAYALPSD
jgi:hypothetical protein